MKLTIAFLIFICTASHAQQAADFGKLSWLEGQWVRTNSKPGRTGIEVWKKTGVNEFTGKGVALKGSDTIFIEKLRLTTKDNHVYYVADVPENKSEIFFEFTQLSNNSFVCENPAHDFPKKIAYQLVNEQTLRAVVSGNGKEIVYEFKRQ